MKLYNDIRKLEHSLKAVKSREDQLGLKALLYTLDIYQVKPMTQNETNLYFCHQNHCHPCRAGEAFPSNIHSIGEWGNHILCWMELVRKTRNTSMKPSMVSN